MGNRLNKEQALFITGCVLLLWAALKLGLFLAHTPLLPRTPKVAEPKIQQGDPQMLDKLPIPDLAHYATRGTRDPFFPDVTQPTTIYVRATAVHTVGTDGVTDSYSFDCRMTPNPAAELRFRIPPDTVPVSVFCRQKPEGKDWGQDGRILSVPIKPDALKRTYYRAQVDIRLRSTFAKLPTQWQVPVVVCRDGMEKIGNVVTETGDVAFVTLRNAVDLIPITEIHRTGLQPLAGDNIPEPLRSSFTKFVYHYKQPAYELVYRVQPLTTVAVAPKPKIEPKVTPKVMPKVLPQPKDIPQPEPEPEPEPKLDIPPPPGDDLPFKLVAIVEIEAPEPKRQVVLRHKDSGDYFRRFIGDDIDGLKLDSITDDAVILIDANGKRIKLRGRFEDKYNE